jgi:hypothetical protein
MEPEKVDLFRRKCTILTKRCGRNQRRALRFVFGIYQVKVDAEGKGSVKQTMHEVDKVEAVQRQQGKRSKRKRIGGTEW